LGEVRLNSFSCTGTWSLAEQLLIYSDLALTEQYCDIAFNHARYKELVLNVIRDYQLECRAPALRKGDVLFWSAKTIHGSLSTTQPQFSRSSMTTHFIPASAGFLQFQTRERQLNLRQIGLFQVDCSKDQSHLKHQIMLDLESRFPQTFQQLKRLAIKLVTR
jgi:phytanoyl-CoA hydroxylase